MKDSEKAEKPQLKIINTKDEFVSSEDAPYCNLLAGCMSWFMDTFGQDYAIGFFRFFKLGDLGEEPFFRKWYTHTWQTRPLKLRNASAASSILQIIGHCDELKECMPKTLTSKESLVNKEFNKVRKIVCRKL